MRNTKTCVDVDWDRVFGNDKRTIQEFTDDELRDELERRRKAKEDGWNKPTKYIIETPGWVW